LTEVNEFFLLLAWNQGDQIGRFFRPLGDCFLFFGQFLNDPSIANFRTAFFRGKSCVLILTTNGLGNLLGDIFTNSSGHPAWNWVSIVDVTHP
jgi:hypothetical protein